MKATNVCKFITTPIGIRWTPGFVILVPLSSPLSPVVNTSNGQIIEFKEK